MNKLMLATLIGTVGAGILLYLYFTAESAVKRHPLALISASQVVSSDDCFVVSQVSLLIFFHAARLIIVSYKINSNKI